MRMRGLVASARAMAMRWRWPPERLAPRSSIDGVVALRQLRDELVGAGEPRRLHDDDARHGGIAERDVLVDRAVEQDVFLQHDADLAAQPAGIELGDVDAVEHHLARSRAVEALHELGEARLAGAGMADEADHLAGARSPG